ncbi:hypothetical protein D9758_012717 [Tetrapyrgos nigripes]|uniref:Reverse transcriptase domain-containing protein n=1 Tax=Tetrapyrgos nigripes TaxID=182062 RepID=A0A8H5FTZ6_9AGAR|nr:hypothetical protein D9758_012717 [Tetrapyrgos nigripes]
MFLTVWPVPSPLNFSSTVEGICRVTTDAIAPHTVSSLKHTSNSSNALTNHCGCTKSSLRQSANLAKFWELFRKYLGIAIQFEDNVSASDLMEVFMPRVNSTFPLPASFDVDQYNLNEFLASAILVLTIDTTSEQFFSQMFDVPDIEEAKADLGKLHPGHSAAGEDEVHYSDIWKMDSTMIMNLVNECLRKRDKPLIWIISILIGVLKKGKKASDPNGYQAIALESCMLKFNGFRKGFRTNKNAVIFSVAIQKAKALNRTLWVASVNISNAFPSVHWAILWLKLQQLGAGGWIFDWIHMIYNEMVYKVWHGDSSSPQFQSLLGILAGDTISLLLWILYFADFNIPKTTDDIELAGKYVSHLKQADDLLILALSPEGLQHKMNLFYDWCKVNFLVINAIKSVVTYHGNPPPIIPVFHFADAIVEVVNQYTYVGTTLHGGPFWADCFHTVLAPVTSRARSG